ncbi:MAG: hypothetical protein QM820_06415 [Minicystis sp.]
MTIALTFHRDRRIKPEETIAALEETGRALSLSFVVRSADDEDDVDNDDDPSGSMVTYRRVPDGNDQIALAIAGPVPIRGRAGTSDHIFGLTLATDEAGWLPAFLFFLHVARRLEMAPTREIIADDDSADDALSFVIDVEPWVTSCVEREVGGDADAEIEITSKRGALGPLQVEGRLAPEGPVIEIRGAGADLSIRLGGSAGSLDAPALDRVIAALRGEEADRGGDRGARSPHRRGGARRRSSARRARLLPRVGRWRGPGAARPCHVRSRRPCGSPRGRGGRALRARLSPPRWPAVVSLRRGEARISRSV